MLVVGSVPIGISKILSMGITFVPGKKNIAPTLHDSRSARERVAAAADWTVLFYDPNDRQAWLLDGPSALLHICRAWLSSEMADFTCTDPRANLINSFEHAQRSKGGPREAMRLLLCPRNWNIELFPNENKPTIESSIQLLTAKKTVEKKTSASWKILQGRCHLPLRL